MTPTLITSIIVGTFGTVILILWGFIQKQVADSKNVSETRRIDERISAEKVRVEDRDTMKDTLAKIQHSIDNQTGAQKELSDAINKVSNMFDKLNLTLQMVERDSSNRFRDLEKRLNMTEAHIETLRLRDIEALRSRDHDLFSHICAIRLQGELKSGWKFAGDDWKLTAVAQQTSSRVNGDE